jgi:ABC-type sugar transport system permease subunit
VAAAQAVVLFLIVLVLTVVQFTFFERRVHYAGETEG